MRVWLDLTGIVPGSDAAALARALAEGLAGQCELRLCAQRPGLVELSRADAALTPVAPSEAGDEWATTLRARGQALPPRLRAALARFVREQSKALAAWRQALVRPTRTSSAPIVDSAGITRGDWLVMLTPSGDNTRLKASGVRLAVALADPLPLCRPDQAAPEAAASAAIWRQTTLAHLDSAIAFSPAGAAALAQSGLTARLIPAAPSLTVSRRPGRHVLALGEIGRGGNTHVLLHAWRRLLDETPDRTVPQLVLAGPCGALSRDIVAQLRNSDGLGGQVRLVTDPSDPVVAALLGEALFTVAMASHECWGRAMIESQAAGVACLSAVVDFDPDDAAGLAEALRSWLAAPPPAPAAAARDWPAVARDLLAGWPA